MSKRRIITLLCKLQMKIHLICHVVLYDIISPWGSGMLTNSWRTKPLEMPKPSLASLPSNCMSQSATVFFLPCGRPLVSPVPKFQRFKSQCYCASYCLSLPSRYIIETFSENAKECLLLEKIQQISVVFHIWLHFLLIVS